MVRIKINATATENPKIIRREIVEKARALLDEIDGDLAVLTDSPTNAQVVQGLIRVIRRQRRIVRFLASQFG